MVELEKVSNVRGAVLEDRPSATRIAPAARRAVTDVLSQPPFAGRCHLREALLDVARTPSVLACVPARDEAERLPASLDSVAASLAPFGDRAAVLVAVNNSIDATFGLVRSRAAVWRERTGLATLACDVRFEESVADAGHARRLALDMGAALATFTGATDAVLLSTDADTQVEPLWAPRMVGHVHRGASLALGRIDTDPAEFDAMPSRVRLAEEAERRLLHAQDRLWKRLVPHTRQALGLRAGGASLAVSAAAYRRVGGVPALPFGEDRALVASMLRHDEPVAVDRTATIRTSCRLEARASYGLGGMLKARLEEPDPLCDEVLWPARDFALRTLAWRHLRESRRTWRIADVIGGVESLVGPLGVGATALFPSARTQGRDWERLSALLAEPRRLRVSEIEREVERAGRILERVTPGASIEQQVAEVLAC